jgi:hypothetical protein
MTSETKWIAEGESESDELSVELTRTQQFGKWLMEREATETAGVDRTYRMLKLNTFLTAAVLAILGGEDSYDLVMTMIWFI